jgi:hypothetical protein
MTTTIVRRGWLSLATLGAFALTLVVGCGGVRRVPVSGTIKLDDQPMEGGYLFFSPDTTKGNTHTVSGMSPIKDGHYTIETRGITRAETGPGLPPGWYKVTFKMLEQSTKKHQVIEPNVNGKFKNPDTTPLSVEVKDNPDPGAYDFNMTK